MRDALLAAFLQMAATDIGWNLLYSMWAVLFVAVMMYVCGFDAVVWIQCNWITFIWCEFEASYFVYYCIHVSEYEPPVHWTHIAETFTAKKGTPFYMLSVMLTLKHFCLASLIGFTWQSSLVVWCVHIIFTCCTPSQFPAKLKMMIHEMKIYANITCFCTFFPVGVSDHNKEEMDKTQHEIMNEAFENNKPIVLLSKEIMTVSMSPLRIICISIVTFFCCYDTGAHVFTACVLLLANVVVWLLGNAMYRWQVLLALYSKIYVSMNKKRKDIGKLQKQYLMAPRNDTQKLIRVLNEQTIAEIRDKHAKMNFLNQTFVKMLSLRLVFLCNVPCVLLLFFLARRIQYLWQWYAQEKEKYEQEAILKLHHKMLQIEIFKVPGLHDALYGR
jgi:hypothetical protein